MRYYLSIYLLFLSVLLVNCDTDSLSSSYARPEVRLVVIDEESTLEGASIGDSITLAIALDLKNMDDLYYLGFKISFNDEIFQPREENPYDYNIDGSFFETTGETIYDLNNNGVLDGNEGWDDENGNDEYDGPLDYPVGIINLGDQDGNDSIDYFEGSLGILDPSTNGNVDGAGRVCKFYLVGILTETVFDIDITDAFTYVGGVDQSEDYSSASWDIYTLLVGSPHEPVLFLQEEENSNSEEISIVLKIEDSPKIASFSAKINFDSSILTYLGETSIDFFDEEDYFDSSTELVLDTETNQGIYYIDYNHNILGEESEEVDLEEEPLSEGWGDIIQLTFKVNDNISETNTTIVLINDLLFPAISGWNSYSDQGGSEYQLDKSYWTIQDSLEINF